MKETLNLQVLQIQSSVTLAEKTSPPCPEKTDEEGGAGFPIPPQKNAKKNPALDIRSGPSSGAVFPHLPPGTVRKPSTLFSAREGGGGAFCRESQVFSQERESLDCERWSIFGPTSFHLHSQVRLVPIHQCPTARDHRVWSIPCRREHGLFLVNWHQLTCRNECIIQMEYRHRRDLNLFRPRDGDLPGSCIPL